ncbi:MAG: IS110 family transposase [Bacteriovoracaceae bacterium]|nr:IS110 family transposase [Bacteriovoracaceae bacterium]
MTAMTLITEIGDIKRFKHPKQLTSYCGLDIAEYSSGGKRKKIWNNKDGKLSNKNIFS